MFDPLLCTRYVGHKNYIRANLCLEKSLKINPCHFESLKAKQDLKLLTNDDVKPPPQQQQLQQSQDSVENTSISVYMNSRDKLPSLQQQPPPYQQWGGPGGMFDYSRGYENYYNNPPPQQLQQLPNSFLAYPPPMTYTGGHSPSYRYGIPVPPPKAPLHDAPSRQWGVMSQPPSSSVGLPSLKRGASRELY